MSTLAREELWFGFNMASLEAMARKAAYESHWRFIEFRERYEVAWSAIAEEIYASDEQPRPFDLIRLGDRAIAAHVENHGHMWGAYYGRSDKEYMPRFEMFWWTQAKPTPSHEDRIVDHIAFRQIWPRLTEGNKRVLLALAIHGDYRRAAESLGKPYATFTTQIWQARKQFLRLWHDGEMPSRVWGHDRRDRPVYGPGGKLDRPVTVTTIRRRRNKRRLGQVQGSTGTSHVRAGDEERLPARVIRRHGPATRS